MKSLLLLLLVLLVATITLVSCKQQKQPPYQQQPRSNTVGMKARIVNMSRLLHIPESLRRSQQVPELIDPSDSALQQRVSKKLRKWALDQLRCEGHISKDETVQEKCFEEMQPLHDSKPFASEQDVVIPRGACGDDFVHAWNILGAIFKQTDENDVVQLGYLTFGKNSATAQALNCDPNYALAWYNIAQRMPTAETEKTIELTLGGSTSPQKFTKRECLVKVVENAPWHSEAWYNLGMTLAAENSFVTVKGKKYLKKDCYVESIRQSSSSPSANGGINVAHVWNNLGSALLAVNDFVEVWPDKPRLSKLNCYEEAVKQDKDFSIAWYNLGSLMQLDQTLQHIHGRSWTKTEALLESLRAAMRNNNKDEENSLRKSGVFWSNVGNALRPEDTIYDKEVLPTEMTKKGCYIKALELDGSLSSAWNNLGSLLPLVAEQEEGDEEKNNKNKVQLVPGPGYHYFAKLQTNNYEKKKKLSFSKKDCYVEAIRHNKQFPTAWQNLGDILGLGLLVTKDGKVRTSSKNVGDLLSKTKSEALASGSNIKYLKRTTDEDYNQQENEEEERELSLLASETVEIEGKSYNKRRCFIEALKLDPEHDTYSWTELGVIAAKEHKKYHSIFIQLGNDEKDGGGTLRVTAKDCFVRAIQADSRNSHGGQQMLLLTNHRAWYNLGVLLNNTETLRVALPIMLNGKVVVGDSDEEGVLISSRRCFIESITINPNHCPSYVALGNTLNETEDKKLGENPIEISLARDFYQNNNGGAKIKIKSKQDAFIQAILCDRSGKHLLSSAWYNLALTMKNTRKTAQKQQETNSNTVTVGRLGSFTMKQCFAKAVSGDPKNADAWYNLGLTLVLDETATVEVSTISIGGGEKREKEKSGKERETGMKVNRKFCFEAYDAIVRGGDGGAKTLSELIEAGVGIDDDDARSSSSTSFGNDDDKFEKFIDDEDDF